jgi:hypothetical protein
MKASNVDLYYDLMLTPYDDASDAEREFWRWVMISLLPSVSSEWSDRVKEGRKVVITDVETGRAEKEHFTHYLSLSDFAYVPMVVKIYGERELKESDDKRKKGRTKGQSGMMSKENIAQYIDSVVRMRGVYTDHKNKENVKGWSNAIFDHLQSLEGNADVRAKARVAALKEAARQAGEQDCRRKKKDEIEIPVE